MIEIISFLGTCSSIEIGNLAEKKGKKFNYQKAIKAIKYFSPEMYNSLALNLRNPWDHETNIKDKKYLHVVHSAVDYLFEIEFIKN